MVIADFISQSELPGWSFTQSPHIGSLSGIRTGAFWLYDIEAARWPKLIYATPTSLGAEEREKGR
jgi:hypothetical protein